jgi:predicted transcriptional regulator
MGHGTDFDRLGPVVIAAVKAGATLAEAAQQAEITERTVKRWLSKGRSDSKSPYASFAFAIDFIRESREAPTEGDGPVDDEEVQLHLSKAIRNGSVAAMKVWTDVYRKQGDGDGDEKPADPLAGLDELAARRASAGA